MTFQRTTVKSFGIRDIVGVDVPVDLAMDKEGYFTDSFVDASVGVEWMRDLVTVFDYAGQRAAVVLRRDWYPKEGGRE